MKKIDKLLDLYFEAKTTLDEELELRQYFASGEISDEHKGLRPLFAQYENERQECYRGQNQAQKPKTRKFKIYFFTSMAASVVLGILVFGSLFQANSDTYIIQNGQKTNNVHLAQSLAEKELSKVNKLLNESMQPLENTKRELHESLEPLQQSDNAMKLAHSLIEKNSR